MLQETLQNLRGELQQKNEQIRELEKFASITTKVVKAKEDDEKAQKFRDYFEWEESLSRIPSHRLLAILRAESEGYIKTKISIDDDPVGLILSPC